MKPAPTCYSLNVSVLGAPKLSTRLGPIAASRPIVYAATLHLGINRGRTIRRAELARLLWPDEDEVTHGERIRWLIYQLKRAGLSFAARDPEMTLTAGEVSLDIDVLSGDRWTDDILATVPGDVLAGYDPQISDTFSRWVSEARDAIRSRVARDLSRWLAVARRDLNWHRMEELARRLLAVDGFHEGASIALAESLAVQGRRVAAAEVLGKLTLAQCAGAPVLASAMVRDRLREHRESARASIYAPAAGTLVGRETLLARILGTTERVVTQRFGLAGPSGMGKSRLLEEVRTISAVRGIQVLQLQCAREDALRPRSLVMRLVRALLVARGALGASPHALELLRPLSAEPWPSATQSAPLEGMNPAEATAPLFAALAELLSAVADDGPLTIMIDDGHRADPSSWAILSHLFPLVSTSSVTWLIALRADTYRAASRQFQTIFPTDEAACDQSRDLLWLNPLSNDAISAICAMRAAPRHVPDEMLSRIVRDAVGVPFFAEAFMEHWFNNGDFTEPPPAVMRLIHSRLDRMGASAECVLAAVAVLGRDATLPALEVVAMRSRAELLAATRLLEDAGIVVIQHGIVAARDKWREAAVQRASRTTWQLLHRTAGEWLEHQIVPARQPSAPALRRIASHWIEAADEARSKVALKRARDAAATAKRPGDVPVDLPCVVDPSAALTAPAAIPRRRRRGDGADPFLHTSATIAMLCSGSWPGVVADILETFACL